MRLRDEKLRLDRDGREIRSELDWDESNIGFSRVKLRLNRLNWIGMKVK